MTDTNYLRLRKIVAKYGFEGRGWLEDFLKKVTNNTLFFLEGSEVKKIKKVTISFE